MAGAGDGAMGGAAINALAGHPFVQIAWVYTVLIVTPFIPNPSYPERLQSQADAEGLTRSSGLHLTTIIRDIERIVQPKDEWCTQEELELFGAVGFMWERVFSMAHRESVESGDLIRPGEFELDGIVGSPDLIYTPDWVLMETKACFRSARKFDELEKHFWAWLVQVKSYALMIGTNTAEIHAFFVAGNWRPPVPCVKSVRLEFTDRELQENWAAIVGHARRRKWLQ